jgi:hypothetical protein
MPVLEFPPLTRSLRALSRELAMPEQAIPSLLGKRSEIARRIEGRQGELAIMRSDLKALDCAIRLFDPDIELPVV